MFRCLGLDETGFGRKCHWMKQVLDESVVGRNHFWMKVSLDEPVLDESVVDEIVFCFG